MFASTLSEDGGLKRIRVEVDPLAHLCSWLRCHRLQRYRWTIAPWV